MATEPDDLTLRLTRTLPVDRERLWQAWTDELATWIWPPSFETDVQLDLAPGTEWHLVSTPRDLAVRGQVVEVDPPHRLVLTWQWDGDEVVTSVTVGLHEREGGTEVLLVHEGHTDAQQVTDHDAGWNDCLDRLEQHLG
jgi:uncharacterized protein YndB with AHSA1/START domain